jgi:hypothetical protein
MRPPIRPNLPCCDMTLAWKYGPGFVGWKPSAFVSREVEGKCRVARNRVRTLCHGIDIALYSSGLVGRATLNREALLGCHDDFGLLSFDSIADVVTGFLLQHRSNKRKKKSNCSTQSNNDDAAYIPTILPSTNVCITPTYVRSSKPTCPTSAAPIMSAQQGIGGHIGGTAAASSHGPTSMQPSFPSFYQAFVKAPGAYGAAETFDLQITRTMMRGGSTAVAFADKEPDECKAVTGNAVLSRC